MGLVQSVQVKYQFLTRDFVCLRLKTFESPPKFLVEFVCEQVDTSMIPFVALLVTRAPPSGNHKLQPFRIFWKKTKYGGYRNIKHFACDRDFSL